MSSAGAIGSDAVPSGGSISEQATRVSGRRFAAHIVDGIVFTFIVVGVILLFTLLPDSALTDVLLGVALVGMLTVGHVAYFVLTQRRGGQTPGKKLVGVRVIDEHGGDPSVGALIKRTVPLLIEYVYVFAAIGMLTSSRRQRFGDRWARTYVVST